MCGIFGMVGTGAAEIKTPFNLLAHRGPDGRGEWRSADGMALLGHTRLAIIDPSPAGAQPMIDPENGNAIVFNGEIYNHNEIRVEIGDRAAWQSKSDTETLLKAYAIWGADCLARLKGMFAFALYDVAKSRLLVARDRMGIKPLYYTEDAAGVMFCSETRPLVKLQKLHVTPAGVAAYLRFGVSPTNEMIFAGIKSLAPGCYLTVDASGRALQSYWAPVFQGPTGSKSPAKRIRVLLENAVSEHLVSDVPVAMFLSGGIDSSILTGLAAKFYPGKLSTFSVGFPQREFDETLLAKKVARRCGAEHTRIELSEQEVLALVQEAVAAMDLPSVDGINTYVVSKMVARAGIKVALTGLGGDELFGGYPSFSDVKWLKYAARIPGWAQAIFRATGEPNLRRLTDVPPSEDAFALAVWRRFQWTDEMLQEAGLPVRIFSEGRLGVWADDFSQISWAEISYYMRDTLLRDSDQMGMAVGLELRVPFLDHDLVEYVLNLSGEAKRAPMGVKGLLVESCRDLLTPDVFDRPKMGFGLPFDTWMRGALRDFVREGIDYLLGSRVMNSESVMQIRLKFDAREIHWNRLWALVVLGHFLRRHDVNRGALSA